MFKLWNLFDIPSKKACISWTEVSYIMLVAPSISFKTPKDNGSSTSHPIFLHMVTTLIQSANLEWIPLRTNLYSLKYVSSFIFRLNVLHHCYLPKTYLLIFWLLWKLKQIEVDGNLFYNKTIDLLNTPIRLLKKISRNWNPIPRIKHKILIFRSRW